MRRLLILGTATALLLAGCGSDGDELSEVEFLAEANEICRVGRAEDIAAIEALSVDGLVSSIRGQVDDIRDLDGPSDLEDELDPVLDEHYEILDRIALSEASFEELFATEDNPFAGVNTQLEAIGLITCAES